MELKKNMRIVVTGDVRGDMGATRVKGYVGTLYKEYSHERWLVRLDEHPGFIDQDGCWIISRSHLSPIPFSNKEASHLLSHD